MGILRCAAAGRKNFCSDIGVRDAIDVRRQRKPRPEETLGKKREKTKGQHSVTSYQTLAGQLIEKKKHLVATELLIIRFE